MEIFLLYLFTRLDPLNHALTGFAVVSSICIFIALMFFPFWNDPYFIGNDFVQLGRKWFRRVCIALVIAGIGAIAVPTQKEAAIILAGYGILEVAKSESAQRLAGKSVELIEQTLDGYLKKPEKK